MRAGDDLETACSCCGGVSAATPVGIFNRPGLSALAYRVGTHPDFKASMHTAISTLPALARLTTREADDPVIALLDGWACILDVLTFYQERIANEGFLRTAVERRSLLELARATGYELGPGVAASTWLAFTLDDSPGSPREVTIPAGTRALSLPEKDEPPQPFETAVDILARPEWNKLRPRTSEQQVLTLNDPVFLRSTDVGLALGDPLLVLIDAPAASALRRVVAVEVDAANERTRITHLPLAPPPPQTGSEPVSTDHSTMSLREIGGPQALTAEPFSAGRQTLTETNVAAALAHRVWPAPDLRALATARGWSLRDLQNHFASTSRPIAMGSDRQGPEPGVYALRVKAACFGHNAPRQDTLPKEMKDVFTKNWDPSHPINKDSNHNLYRGAGTNEVIFLDSIYPGIAAGSWVALTAPSLGPAFLEVVTSEEVFRSDFAMSGKVTRLTLQGTVDLSQFPLRETSVCARNERLDLAEKPVTAAVGGDRIELERLDLQLDAGRMLLLTGEAESLAGVETSEVVLLAGVFHDFDRRSSLLILSRPLGRGYKLETIRLNGNVVLATHGETVAEPLGGGDASRAFQSFPLRDGPLTYVPAPVPSGGESTLEVRVDGIRWHEAQDFYGLAPRDRKYVLRRDDPGGTTVLFGDGIHGARVPTGEGENVTAVYRKGSGMEGQVAAGQISLLDNPPLGVSEVVNPLPATGAGAPEVRDDARRNAPLTVRSLDRIVSLLDYEDFARAFSGIGKAWADWVWDGTARVVHLTIAAEGGGEVPAGSEQYRNLLAAIGRSRDPFQPLRVDSYDRLTFNLEAKVRVHTDFRTDFVLKAAEEALRETFSFAARDLAQGVPLSEVIAILQRIEGVEAVDVDAFYLSQATIAGRALHARLDALPARQRPVGGVAPTQHLSLSPQGLILGVMP